MNENKLTNRQIQSKKTQEKIYNTAIELIEEKGFHNIKVSEICEVADVSIGSFYNCFKSKNDILTEIFKVGDQFFLDDVSNNIMEGTALERIDTFFRYYAEFNVERGLDFVKQLYHVDNNLFAIKGRQIQAVLKTVIVYGQSTGEIASHMTPDEIVAYLFVAVRGAVYNWCLHDGQYDLVHYIDRYVKLLVKAIID
ncbi:transcriptional regulator, TetR family [Alkaliphilus metalliredigens QYMF]|uniref:Transcriptional regulator, TetR family n=1 Tax=Alkaliphilus metalliredigens (strain QYMF) TaxID=293826 RepID=A6TTW4_ALKMQ|nr:TetR/AcrR family transcriptional regulator [Alkaliphilus metalliredigens]ABR49632.1 transcriptional regulator, TetR family [Alkaliphilus metalliredigens QYMF]